MRENGTPFATLIIVVLAALAAAQLLLAALVIWLAECFGSIITPCLVVGLFMALLGFVVYKVSLQNIVRELHERLNVVYEVTSLIRKAVEWSLGVFYRKADRQE
uniref:hypothetical protein n=1 Tax=Alistipes sp. TaxID=1872444 RepID=UPI004057B663